ncbi:CLUMA_CG003564, isoform A [Clunio marinus]|uniref:CLUMA_CG003564, isoform A n=1 Tax=Clunio marinus TaxID=568069 RepID=A0A1J1HP96_9DIPT|nr:CLUMA_CG003564, isoform A [Clunio marinus]
MNLHNLNHCESLTSFHSATQSQHQNQVGASPKNNKKNYLKLKIFTKRIIKKFDVNEKGIISVFNRHASFLGVQENKSNLNQTNRVLLLSMLMMKAIYHLLNYI